MIATTTAEDAQYIADNLSDDEICVRLYGRKEASRLAFEVATTSPLSWVVYSAMAEPVAMFGANGDKGDQCGWAWMVCTNRAKKAARSIVQGTTCAIAMSREWWPELRIEAEPRSERQAKFLEWIGFRPANVEIREGEAFVELVI